MNPKMNPENNKPRERVAETEDFPPVLEPSLAEIDQDSVKPIEEKVNALKSQEYEHFSRTNLNRDNTASIRLAPKIEAILYLRGQPLSVADLMESTQSDREAIEDALIELMSDYAHRDSALEVVETATGYCLQLRNAFQSLIDDLVPAELGTGALRTLAAIALKSPILQSDLIELRGSSAYQQVQELVEQGFVRKRRQNEGRSYWLEVTDKFHQYFEIEQLSHAFEESSPQ
jgi:segregation and condensation protein B